MLCLVALSVLDVQKEKKLACPETGSVLFLSVSLCASHFLLDVCSAVVRTGLRTRYYYGCNFTKCHDSVHTVLRIVVRNLKWS